MAVPAALVALVLAGGCDLAFRAEAREAWKRSYPLAEGGTLEIQNTNGRIFVEAGDGKTVEVVADKVARAGSDEDARNTLGRIEIAETVTPDRIRLEGSRRGLGFQLHASWRIDYTVRVPSSANVRLVATNGDLEARDLTGLFEARATNGRVRASGLGGGAAVETTNGQVSLDFASVSDRGISCETTNGSIDVTVPRDAKAHVTAEVTNGAIDVGDVSLAVSEKSRRRVEGTMGGGGPLIRLEATNGRVVMRGR